ncbi:AAEL011946-PA [Aedes aegypti]|uniref:AAEL011946-PA n=2 Tax=Aedes aegypti TaxID=7159 RepID=A0A1S4FUS6_AEDAE|nr:uncharacterized protein LOC5575616 [Aedes aegypti]EAT35932.1 AAEL011946-PA [Aedes aegypti]
MIEPGSGSRSVENAARADEAFRRCVVYLTIAALALTGLGYDPHMRSAERKAAEEAEAETEHEEFYTGIEDEAREEEEDVEINWQLNIYVARMLAPVVVCFLIHSIAEINFVRRIYGVGHVVVCVIYKLLSVPKGIDILLLICGFCSEFCFAGKMLLYIYQIVIYSPTPDRSSYVIYGIIAQCFGASILPWIVNELEETWEHFQSFLNLVVTMVQFFLLYPCDFWKDALTEGFDDDNELKFRKLLTIANFGVVALASISNVTLQWFINNNETLLRPLLPFFVGDEFWDTFWNIVFNGISFTFLGFFCIFLSTHQLMIASFLITFLTGVAYLYLEEDIGARLAIPMTAFTFAVALLQLLSMCPPSKLLLLMGSVFTIVNLASYGYFGLLTLFWSSPDIVIVVVWAVNGFYALILLVLSRELVRQKGENAGLDRDRSGSFKTVVTTIT